MALTVDLVLTDETRLRQVSNSGLDRVIELVGGTDRDPTASQRQLDLIREACVGMSLVVKEETTRFAHDKRRYFDGASAAEIIKVFSASTASGTAMVVLLRTISSCLQQWLKNRSSRSVRLRIGDKSVEIKGTRDVSAAVKALQSLEQIPSKRRVKGRRKRKP